MSEGHVLVLLSNQRLNWHSALHVIWLPRACNVVTVTLESNVDKQMISWQSDVCTFKKAISTNFNKPHQ